MFYFFRINWSVCWINITEGFYRKSFSCELIYRFIVSLKYDVLESWANGRSRRRRWLGFFYEQVIARLHKFYLLFCNGNGGNDCGGKLVQGGRGQSVRWTRLKSGASTSRPRLLERPSRLTPAPLSSASASHRQVFHPEGQHSKTNFSHDNSRESDVPVCRVIGLHVQRMLTKNWRERIFLASSNFLDHACHIVLNRTGRLLQSTRDYSFEVSAEMSRVSKHL